MKEASRRTECGGDGGLFEDPDFPCADSSLFSDRSTPVARLQGGITWQRPQEICQSPVLFPGNVDLGHAKQGLLGDCWFLCACTFLLKNPQLLNKVLPPDQPQWGDSGYRGSFRFCFWQQGVWTEVTVDDRLPCINAALCFSRCHCPAAFWVALLEKAYAKLRGCYERLWAGQVSEALVDLTGGVAERWSLGESGSEKEEEEEEEEQQDSDRVPRRRLDLELLQAVKDDCALSCSTHSAPGGVGELDQYHALTVMEWVDGRKVEGGEVRLLRIRNPWGRCCWAGAWTRSGAGWSSLDPTCAAELQSRTAEGEFWLDEAEFMSQFDDITVGYPVCEGGHLKSIYTGNLLTHSHQLAGRWTRALSAGGSRNSSSYCTNPKFWLKVGERGEVVMSLLQQRQRTSPERRSRAEEEQKEEEQKEEEAGSGGDTKHQQYHAIALHTWKVEKKRFNLSRMVNKRPCASTHCHTYQREVVLRGLMEPGYYLLIPSTYQPGAEARFLLRVFSSSPTSLSALKSPAASLPPAADGEWETSHVRGSWEEGSTAGGSRNFPSHRQNPRFPLTVFDQPAAATPSAVNVRITLQQNRADTELHAIGFHVYKVAERRSEPWRARDEDPVASCVPHCYTRDVSLSCRLPPGDYVIVPSTYQPHRSANFTLSLSRRIHRKVVKSQERLGNAVQEVSHVSVMHSSLSRPVAAPLMSSHLTVPLGPR